MEREGLFKRFLLPLFLVVGINLIAGFIYDTAAGFPPGPVRELLISVFAPLLFVSLWFFAFVGPPLAFYLGSTFGERLVIAYANPVIWIVSVEAKVACQYCSTEMVYFFFLPWTFGIVCVTAVQFSVAELICRFVAKRRSQRKIRVLHPAVITLLTVGIIGTYFGLIKGQEWVYTVVHHYKSNFL